MGNLSTGSTGATVKTLQKKLNKAGAKPALKVDGVFGPKTKQAVLEFQKRHKDLSNDGIAGKNTLARLDQGLKGGGKAPDSDPKAAAEIKHFLGYLPQLKSGIAAFKKLSAERLKGRQQTLDLVKRYRKEIDAAFDAAERAFGQTVTEIKDREKAEIKRREDAIKLLEDLKAAADKAAFYAQNKAKLADTIADSSDGLAIFNAIDNNAARLLMRLQASLSKANGAFADR